MKTGLFFGSFNPVHTGHMIIASYMAEYTDLEQVWMVVSPHNPLKEKSSLARDNDRLFLVQQAIGDYDKIKASNIEFSLPVPSYTIDTLTYLKEKYPDRIFALIMGSDNLQTLSKWKNYEQILRGFDIYVYRRSGSFSSPFDNHERVYFVDAPLIEISSTFIRNAIRQGRSVRYLVPDSVLSGLESANMYRTKLTDES
jgi:nicotinate-nucleotide adenylyltransferase